MSLQRFANAPIPSSPSTPWSTLSIAIDADDTTVVPVSDTPFPSLAQFDVLCENEILTVTVGGASWTVTRGAHGTTAVAHAAGTGLFHVVTAGALARLARSMTTLGDMEYLDAAGGPARLAAPGDGLYGVSWASGVPSWGSLAGYVTLTGVETLTNKTLTTPTIASFVNAAHSHLNAAGGGTLDAAAIAAGTIGLARISGLTVSQFASANISQWTNDAGYLTTAVTSLTGTANQITASAATGAVTLSVPNNAQLHVAKLTNLAGNGFVKTSGGDGTLSVDTTSYTTLSAVAALYAPLISPTLTGPVTINEAVGSSGLTITGATQTTSQPALNITQTWNAAQVFTAVKVNVTSTSSSAGSNIVDFQIGGSSKLALDKDGYLKQAIGGSFPYYWIYADATRQIASGGSALLNIGSAGVAIHCASSNLYIAGTLNWQSSFSNTGSNVDITLARDAANVLAQRNSTNAQTFRLYNTYTDASNYERLSIGWTSNQLVIAPENAGTGSARNLRINDNQGNVQLQASGASGTNDAHLLLAINTKTGATAPRVTIGNGGSFVAGSGTLASVQVVDNVSVATTSTFNYQGLKIAPTINFSAGTPGAGSYEALKIAVTETALPTGTNYLIRASAGSAGTTDKFTVDNSGNIVLTGTISATASSGTVIRLLGSGTIGVTQGNVPSNTYVAAGLAVSGGITGVSTSSTGMFGWTNATTSATTTIDVALYRDAAATLALRNGTNAQTFNIYNTYTDASNYERFRLSYVSNTFHLTHQAAGTGTLNRGVEIDAYYFNFKQTGVQKLGIGGGITIADGVNLDFGTTTGTKWGTSTSQKQAWWNQTPITQPSGIVDADGTLADVTTKFNSLISKMEAMGLLATV